MDLSHSPPKRRRLSPPTSIKVTLENTELGQLLPNGASPSKRRSSFMSPTKASLARFYPSLLPRAKSAEPTRPVSRETYASVKQISAGEGGVNGSVVHVASTAPQELESGMNGVEERQALPATPRRSSQSSGGNIALESQEQPPMNPEPRASPPAELTDEGTTVSGTAGGVQNPVAEAADIGSTGVTSVPDSQNPEFPSTPMQRKAHVPASGMGVGEDGEPSLPSTPSQLGLEPPREKPNGLPFSNPSRRPKRKRRSIVKSSPLKPLDVPLEHPNLERESPTISLGPRLYIANTPRPPPQAEEAHLLQLRNRLKDLEKQLQDIEDQVLRQLLVSSWQQDRSKEGTETAKRRKDVAQRSTKIVHLRNEILKIQTAQNINHRQDRREATEHQVVYTKGPSLTQRLADLLPFSVPCRLSEPTSPSPIGVEIDLQALEIDTLQPDGEPFTITTSDELLLSPTEDSILLQRQNVKLSTSHQLLTCSLQVTANVATQQISHLDITALSPWAEPELGLWLRQSRESMELVALGRAFGRYWEVAKQRGKCWISCKRDFKDLVANAPNSNCVLSYLGIQDLIFARSNVQLKVDWRISLSEGGDVESHSTVHPRFPLAWQEGAGIELAKIGDAFTMLVEDRGIAEAIEMMCRVVFPR